MTDEAPLQLAQAFAKRRHPARGLATRLGAGELARRYYHEPLSNLRLAIREGGPFQQRRTELGRLEMVEAARRLPPLWPPAPDRGLEVSFLSGAKYWYQTLFCIYSLQLCCERKITPTIFDDGSFTDDHLMLIRRAIPWAEFVLTAEIDARLDAWLPPARFPSLRARRIVYPHLRKLCDAHVGRRGWTTVMDSDMLFFRRPAAWLEWSQAPDRPCHMIDVERAYGYSPLLMRELAGCDEPERVNVGLCALNSQAIDWDRLEFWCRATIEREGAGYLQEQALTALLLAGQDCLRLPQTDYQVRPLLTEGRRPTAVLHHYVAEAKRAYFQHGWRRIAQRASQRAVG